MTIKTCFPLFLRPYSELWAGCEEISGPAMYSYLQQWTIWKGHAIRNGIRFNVHGFVHRKNILIYEYIQHDVTFHCLFYLETAVHVSGDTITHHQKRKQQYLRHLVFVTPLLPSAAIVEELELVWVCCGWRTPLGIWGSFVRFHPGAGSWLPPNFWLWVPGVVSLGVKDRSVELTTPIYGRSLRLLSAAPPPQLPPWHAQGQLTFTLHFWRPSSPSWI
jgi:hypothetical protein